VLSCKQVILEEGGDIFSTPGENTASDFAFPGVHEQELQDVYVGMDAMHEGPAPTPSASSFQSSPQNTSAPALSEASVGKSHALSTSTLPSQSLTGLLAGANELLGEIGTSQMSNLTGAISHTAPTSQHSHGLQQQKPPTKAP
jgi:hypothetical protein